MKKLSRTIELRAAQALFRLPPGALVRLSGRPPVRMDGQTLDPEMQLLLALRERRFGTAMLADTPEQARRDLRRETLRYSVQDAVGSVQELQIDSTRGPLRARHYVPEGGGRGRPLLVFFHGGGFVTGDLDTHDAPCRYFCKHAGVHVLSVEYRLAPEHPFPAAVEDAIAAFTWAHEHAAELGADPERVGVGGDSAGANLSIALSRMGARGECPEPVLQLLLYPPTDRVEEPPSMKMFDQGFLLTRETIDWFNQSYFGYDWNLAYDPRISPLRDENLPGQCPAIVVTAGFDPLRDEGEAYVTALERTGTRVRFKRYEGLVHGFINMHTLSPAARRAMHEIVEWLQEELDSAARVAKRAS